MTPTEPAPAPECEACGGTGKVELADEYMRWGYDGPVMRAGEIVECEACEGTGEVGDDDEG